MDTNRNRARSMAEIVERAQRSEKATERYLCERCAARGWRALKYYNPNETGYPDRLILLPGGRVAWVELKSAGRRPTALQRRRGVQLAGRGHMVFVCASREAVDACLEEIGRRLNPMEL